MAKTSSIGKQVSAEQMRNRGYVESAVRGIEHIRALDDDVLLAAARDEKGTEHAAIVAHMSADGTWTNPSWVTGSCAEEAYERDLIGEQELDWLMR